MQLKTLKQLLALPVKSRGLITAFMSDGKVRAAVQKAMQAKGIGVGIDPNNIQAWIDLILKNLPAFIDLIVKIIAAFSKVPAKSEAASAGSVLTDKYKDVATK